METRGPVRIPAPGIPVEISSTRRAVTDRDGSFSIGSLPEGTYVLNVNGPFHEPLITNVRIEGDTRLDLEIVPLPVYTVSGVVYEDTEEGPVPVAGVLVNNSAIHDSARSDTNGAYRVSALRGVAGIDFSKSGYLSQVHTIAMEGDVRLDVKLVRR